MWTIILDDAEQRIVFGVTCGSLPKLTFLSAMWITGFDMTLRLTLKNGANLWQFI